MQNQHRDISENHGGSSSEKLARYYLEIIHALSLSGRDPENPMPEDNFAAMVEMMDVDGLNGEQFRSLVQSPPGEEGGSGKVLFFIKDDDQYLSIGFTSAKVQDGDILAIPYGLNQIFVLRRVPYAAAPTNESCFKIVELAYVAGLKNSKTPRSSKTPLVQAMIRRPRVEVVIY